ncbi:MAG: hypothetical protein HFJ27_03715 [Clostridia bacterium]|nr:hypothetical protein [Clostridia bacterium]
MKQLKEKITVPNIIILFIILQPVIDIVTSLSIQYANLTITFGIIIRTLFMIGCVILGIIKASKKYRIGMCSYYGILGIYMIGFLVNCYLENQTHLLLFQIKGLIKNFYLPIMIVALIPIFRQYKVEISNKTLTISLMIYVITIFVSSIIGVANLTYKAGDKAGTVGLFYSANEIGAILCLLSPFLVIDLMKKKITIKDVIFFGLLCYAILQIGTKVPYFGFMMLLCLMIFTGVVYAKIHKDTAFYKKSGVVFGILITVYIVTGLTPVGENLTKIYGDIFLVTKEDIQFGKEEKPPQVTEFKNFEELKAASISGRNDFLEVNKEKFLNGNFADKVLGIGFVEKQDEKIQELKLTEMDYYDILFCNGILGTILFAIPIFAFMIAFIRYTMLNKKQIPIEAIYSITMAAVVALLAGHVLVSPAVSIYVVIILLKYDIKVRNMQNVENT